MAKLLIVGGTGFFGKSILTYLSNNRLRKKFELIYILSKKKRLIKKTLIILQHRVLIRIF